MTKPNILLRTAVDERTSHSNEMVMRMMALSMCKNDDSPVLNQDSAIWDTSPLFRVAKSCVFRRLEVSCITFTQNAFALMLSLMDGNLSPGNLVLAAYTLKCIAEHNDRPCVNIADVASAFTFDSPAPKAWERAWDGQKCEGANWLDTDEAWKSKWST